MQFFLISTPAKRGAIKGRSSLCRFPLKPANNMSGIIFSDTFFIEGIDWDPVKKVVQKKFDKGKLYAEGTSVYDRHLHGLRLAFIL